MKKILFAILCLIVSGPLFAGDSDFVYTDATSLSVCGKLTEDTFEPFSRLPLDLKDQISGTVWKLGRNSAGIFIRFSSDAGRFSFKWKSTFGKSLPNITGIATRGMALYVLDKGKWVFLCSQKPGRVKEESVSSFSSSYLKGKPTEYMLYLSLYDGVQDLRIGVPEGCTISPSTLNSPRMEKPVIIYGTSILQGASASHPGMCGTAQLSRRLDRQVINLGFSGNCKLEEPMARYLASYQSPGMYVLDNWNGKAEIGEKRLEKFIRILLEAHPDTPVLVASRPLNPNARFDEKARYEFDSKNDVAVAVVKKLRKEGHRNVKCFAPYVLGEENDGYSDGIHFTDEAFRKWTDALEREIKIYRKVLEK